MDKQIRKFATHGEQKAEVYRFWRGRSSAERLQAVWEATASAYAFANSFKGLPQYDPTRRSTPTLARIERERG